MTQVWDLCACGRRKPQTRDVCQWCMSAQVRRGRLATWAARFMTNYRFRIKAGADPKVVAEDMCRIENTTPIAIMRKLGRAAELTDNSATRSEMREAMKPFRALNREDNKLVAAVMAPHNLEV